MIRAIWAALACVLLAGCVTTALEPQNQRLKSQNARIYLIWPNQVFGGTLPSQGVLIDDQSVGKIGNGSYLSADRPAGRHKITIQAVIGTVQVEHQFYAVAGWKYFFTLNMRSMQIPVMASGIFVNVRTPGTSVGRPVEGTDPQKVIYLATVNETAAKALMSELDRP